MTYRAIEVSKEDRQIPADQPAPMLDWVRIDRMVIDETYQRDLGIRNWAAIRKIAADFHWSRFSPVLLAPVANGRFAIIDGQHRTHAAAICGFEAVPAMIVPIDRSEQANAFAWVNSAVTKITPHHIYKAALAAREPWAVTAHETVTGAGCQLMTYNPSSSTRLPRQIYCIGLIRDLVKMGNADALGVGLKAIASYDTTGRVPLYSDYVLRPFVTAIAESPDFMQLDLVAFLNRHDPFSLMKIVDKLLAEEKISGSPRILYRKMFAVKMRDMVTAVAA